METLKKIRIQIFYTIGLYTIMVFFFNSCSNDKDYEFGNLEDPVKYTFVNSLKFTDTEDFDGTKAEEIFTDGSNHIITLTLKDTPFDPSIKPNDYCVSVDIWNDQTELWEDFPNEHQGFYKVYTKRLNDEPVICVELAENPSDKVRKIELLIWTGILGNGYYICGLVDIIQSPTNTESEKFLLKAKYKGSYFSTEAMIDDNGDLSFFDSEYASLMEKIDSMKDAEMLVLEDETIYYYDQEDIQNNLPYKDILSLDESENKTIYPFTRADGFEYDEEGNLGYFAIFDNDHFKGANIYKGLTNFHFTHNLPNLKTHGMNDKVTSIAVGYNATDALVCSVLTIWEDTNYNNNDDNRSKHRISIIASKNSPKTALPDLKKIKKIGSSKSWNDCISAISFHFGYIDRLLLDY